MKTKAVGLSARKYALLRGLSHVAVSQAVKRGRIPTHDGLIDPEEADAALEKHDSTLAEALRRKTQAQAEREELRLLREQGELVPIVTVRRAQEAINAVIRARLLAVPGKMAPLLAGLTAAEIKVRLDAEIYEVLSELASRGSGRSRAAS